VVGSLLPSPDIHGYKSIQMLNDWVVKGAEPAKFTEVTDVVLITRDNFKVELKKKVCNRNQGKPMPGAE
jgi:L-arabinose transport system substrate-binding protein